MWAGSGRQRPEQPDLWLIFGWAGFTAGGHTWLAVPAMGVEAAIATSVGTIVAMLINLVMLGPGRALPTLPHPHFRAGSTDA
ncbi:MAG: hypothetical protein R3D98_10225 [Candidatus Krumholzibacteriia bacterium]